MVNVFVLGVDNKVLISWKDKTQLSHFRLHAMNLEDQQDSARSQKDIRIPYTRAENISAIRNILTCRTST